MYLLPIKTKLCPNFSESKEKLEIPDTQKKSTVDTSGLQSTVSAKGEWRKQLSEVASARPPETGMCCSIKI